MTWVSQFAETRRFHHSAPELFLHTIILTQLQLITEVWVPNVILWPVPVIKWVVCKANVLIKTVELSDRGKAVIA